MTLIGRLAAAAGTVGLLLVAWALPSSAADNGFVVTITQPAATVGTSAVRVTGDVRAGAGLQLTTPRVEKIDMQVFLGETLVTSASSQRDSFAPETFDFTGTLSRNGNYRVVVSATGTTTAGLGTASGDASKTFALAAPPAAPQGVTTKVNDDRTVTVSWNRNTEPDVLAYRVFRTDPGAAQDGEVGSANGIAHSSCSSKCTFTDATLLGGGQYQYQVLAFRPNPVDASRPIPSAPSRATSAQLPEPTTTTAPPELGVPAPGTPGAPATTQVPGAAVRRGISTFLSSQPAPKPPPPPKILEPPDTGFNPDLPFAERPADDDVEPGEEEAQAPILPSGNEPEELAQSRPLVPVAAGLILLLLAAHMRTLMKRSNHPEPAYSKPVRAQAGPDGLLVAPPGGRRRRERRERTVAPRETPVQSRPTVTVFASDRPERLVPKPVESGWDNGDIDREVLLVDAAARSRHEAGAPADDHEFDDAVVYEVVSPLR
ncbi:MAG: hypothetical protein ACRD0Q_09515 [Acidimicrobiales bacterium]